MKIAKFYIYVCQYLPKIIETTAHDETARIERTFLKFLLKDDY